MDTLFICVTGVLAACSGGGFGSVLPSINGSTHRATWSTSTPPPTVFVASDNGQSVEGYNQQTGALTEDIALGQGEPGGLAVDGRGNLYVALWYPCCSVNVYPPGSTNPSSTLTYEGASPFGVAISSQGQVAVGDQNTGTIYFYKSGATKPFKSVSSSSVTSAGYDCYDSNGNLFFVATSPSFSESVVAEIAAGGKSVKILRITNLKSPSGIEVDGTNHLLVLDASVFTIYHYPLPNPGAPSGSTIRGGNLKTPMDFALTSSEKAVWVTDYRNNEIAEYSYPKGGWPKKWIRSYGFYNNPNAVAVYPAPKL